MCPFWWSIHQWITQQLPEEWICYGFLKRAEDPDEVVELEHFEEPCGNKRLQLKFFVGLPVDVDDEYSMAFLQFKKPAREQVNEILHEVLLPYEFHQSDFVPPKLSICLAITRYYHCFEPQPFLLACLEHCHVLHKDVLYNISTHFFGMASSETLQNHVWLELQQVVEPILQQLFGRNTQQVAHAHNSDGLNIHHFCTSHDFIDYINNLPTVVAFRYQVLKGS